MTPEDLKNRCKRDVALLEELQNLKEQLEIIDVMIILSEVPPLCKCSESSLLPKQKELKEKIREIEDCIMDIEYPRSKPKPPPPPYPPIIKDFKRSNFWKWLFR